MKMDFIMFRVLNRIDWKSSYSLVDLSNLVKFVHRTACGFENFKDGKKKHNQNKPETSNQINPTTSSNNTGVHSLQTKTLEFGVVVKDLQLGKGAIAKSGKQVNVFYVGYLKESNTIFDSHTKGKGFKFNLGRGEVIKGWDIGVPGMKVGGKRVVLCPPNAAYGSKGSPPLIPADSTLVFEIELKSVN